MRKRLRDLKHDLLQLLSLFLVLVWPKLQRVVGNLLFVSGTAGGTGSTELRWCLAGTQGLMQLLLVKRAGWTCAIYNVVLSYEWL